MNASHEGFVGTFWWFIISIVLLIFGFPVWVRFDISFGYVLLIIIAIGFIGGLLIMFLTYGTD
jgi:hypothetical protein